MAKQVSVDILKLYDDNRYIAADVMIHYDNGTSHKAYWGKETLTRWKLVEF